MLIEKIKILEFHLSEKQRLHTLLRMISGARYSGVPHNVQVLPFTRLANPKSVTYMSEVDIHLTLAKQ